GGDPGHAVLRGGAELPAARPPRRLALLKTAGWSQLERGARAALDAELRLLRGAGVEIISDAEDAELATLETALAEAWPLTERILSWEFCWPLRSYPHDQLSKIMQARLAVGLAMSLDDYETALARRAAIR